MKEQAITLGNEIVISGILTQPEPEHETFACSKPMILLTNAGLLHRVGPHRQWVDLARLLSEDGFTVFRFDITGLGDSAMREDQLSDEIRSVHDFIEVMDYLEKTQGVQSFVIIGLCSGAEYAHNVALSDHRVVGSVFIDARGYRTWGWYLHYYLAKIIEFKKWPHRLRTLYKNLKAPPSVSTHPLLLHDPSREETQSELAKLVNRDIDMLFIYTSSAQNSINYSKQFRDMYPKLDWKNKIQVEYYSFSDHTFTIIVHRQWLHKTIRDWLQRY